MGTRQRLKQRVSPRRGTVISSALVVAFFALTPVAMGEPADEQYNFNPPSPGGDSGSTPTGDTGAGVPVPSSDSGGPAGPNVAKSKKDDDKEAAGKGNKDKGFDVSTGPRDASTGSSPDGSALSAVGDSVGLGLMPIVIGAIAAIGVAGASIALYRRRGSRDAFGEPA